MDTNMQFTINSSRQLFPDKIFFPDKLAIPDISRIFSKIPDISLTAVKFLTFQLFQTSGHPELSLNSPLFRVDEIG